MVAAMQLVLLILHTISYDCIMLVELIVETFVYKVWSIYDIICP